MATDSVNLAGRRIQIAGSANKATDVNVIRYGHRLVSQVVRGVLVAGGGLVLAVGREPRADDGDESLPSLVFDWTALEAVASVLRDGAARWPRAAGLPVVVVASEKADAEIPQGRRALWNELLASGSVQLESIMPGSRAAALIRQRQAAFGEVLLTLGGGTGVEHLADLYLRERRTVIPLDLPLGASRGDGTGGSERLAQESRAEPGYFIRMQRRFKDRANAELAGLATRKGVEPDTDVAQRIVGLLGMLAPPTAFYVRLLNKKHESFPRVEKFFREVVDPVVAEAGLQRIDMGTDETEHGFINVGIFDSLHFARVAIVDLTGSRQNCFIEMGYAFGRATRVLVTAEDGTQLPFDTDAIPCHFWKPALGTESRQEELKTFWKNNINRPPLVCPGVG
jgi:hypothetical protein